MQQIGIYRTYLHHKRRTSEHLRSAGNYPETLFQGCNVDEGL